MKKALSLMLVLALVLTMASFPTFADAPTVTLLGANIRLESDDRSAGIRFAATIDKASAGIEGTYVYSDEAEVKFGMYLLPADLLGDAATLADYIAAGGDKALDIPAKKIYAQNDKYLTYTAVLTGIPESGYAREILAVPYVVSGGNKTFHDEAKDSYVAVAKKALDSFNGTNENGITPEQAEALEKIVEAGTPVELEEKKVELVVDNIALNRYFPANDWTGADADFTPNLNLVLDGSIDTYAYSGVWGNPTDVLSAQGFRYELVVDLGAEKNLSKINVHAGAENYGNGWQFASPLNPEILVAGEDEEFTSVYTYTASSNEAYRLDSVTLDHTANGAGVRYIKYTFTNIYANPAIAEIEVYEMAAGESTTPEGPGTDEPEVPDAPAEPEVITGIVVYALANFTISTEGRSMQNLVDGINGPDVETVDWTNQLISTESYATTDPLFPLFGFYYDMGAKYKLTNFFVGIGWDGPTVVDSTLYGSNDNMNWTPIKSGIETTWGDDYGAGYRGNYAINTEEAYQYYKYEVTELSGEGQMYFHETQFTGVRVIETTPDEPEVPGGDTPELDVPTGDPVNIILSANSITTAPTGTGDLANLFDADEATGYLVAYNYSWSGASDPLTSNNVFEIDLGAPHYNPELKLVWGGQGTHGWGWTAPGDYTVYYAGEDGVYTEAVKYTDLFTNVTNGTLPEGMTASRAYADECILTAITPILANGVRYIKVEMNSFRNSGVALNEVSVKGVPNTTSGGNDPEEPNPDVPGGETVITEQKVALTIDNFTFERYFPDSDWRDAANFANTEFIVDGDYTNYTEWDQYRDAIETLSCYAEITIDLGEAKNLSKIDFYTGVEGFGSDGWSFAAPVNPEILVAGEDGVYTSVYTYEGTVAEATRLDSVTLDYTTDGANVRYIKYRFNTVVRASSIAEVEVFEMVEKTDEGGNNQPSTPETIVYYDIDAAATLQNLSYTNATLPASMFVLPEGYQGFKINGTYKVDADTMRLLAKTPCTGTGTVKYKDYLNYSSYIATVDASWGQYDDQGYGADNYGVQITAAPVSKLSDPVYMSMVLPSDGRTYMDKDNKPSEYKNSGNNMHAPSEDTVFNRLNALGAVYINKTLKSELKEKYSDRQVTVCIGNIRLLIRTADGWISKNMAVPSAGFGMLYALPWQLEWELGSDAYARQLCVNTDNSMTRYSNYTAIKMNVSDFLENKRGHWWQGSTTFDERVFHFWGDVYYLNQLGISEDTEVLGVISSFEVWIEEEDLAPYFIATSGADWRLESGATRQAFSSLQAAITTEKKIVMGHSFGAEDYEEYVAPDLDYIRSVLGV